MRLRIVVGLAVGASAGLTLNLLTTRVLGSACPLTCNPYAAIGLGTALGLMWALGH